MMVIGLRDVLKLRFIGNGIVYNNEVSNFIGVSGDVD